LRSWIIIISYLCLACFVWLWSGWGQCVWVSQSTKTMSTAGVVHGILLLQKVHYPASMSGTAKPTLRSVVMKRSQGALPRWSWRSRIAWKQGGGNGAYHTTLAVPLWVFVMIGILHIIVKLLRKMWLSHDNICAVCKYPLVELPPDDRCPECGNSIKISPEGGASHSGHMVAGSSPARE
jgi:hypothetical protein